jgi:hypothetical protein
MTVRAHYSDGSDRDVTDLASSSPVTNLPRKIGADGTITTGQRGEAFVMARFATYTVGAQVIVVPQKLNYQPPHLPVRNFVDEWSIRSCESAHRAK